MTTATPPPQTDTRILDALQHYWGYESLRPLQQEAIAAGLARRDSLVVLPTGGGKSLCYQIPAVIAGGLDVVISPLISLMKDQVDALRQCGYPAAALHSNLLPDEKREIQRGLEQGEYRLLFVSPERLGMSGFVQSLRELNVRAFSIDEAHCISQWGHDFRPEYRQLALLNDRFPGASLHAYTATATERVRADIVNQLRLDDPQVLVGCFDRPNLTYRTVAKTDAARQVIDVLRRHADEASIVYCLSRKDTEALAATLTANGFRAAHYHAGLSAPKRSATQDDFAKEKIDVVVATVAFGMGIDRSNVRCVIHANVPKSIEHYQQETGRAGRDGLDAECVLLYSYGDVARWRSLMARSAAECGSPQEHLEAQFQLLDQMAGLCSRMECRHRALSTYFGQEYQKDSCDACDVCLGEVEGMADAAVIAQKILSCVARTGQTFGIGYIVQVLRGANTEQVRSRGHNQASTFGLLKSLPEKVLTHVIYQLVDLGVLGRTDDEYPTLHLNDASLAVLRGERDVTLVDPGPQAVKKTSRAAESWEGVDRELFEELRALRRDIASAREVPAFVIFGDETLRGLARTRPTSPAAMGSVKGIGEKKLADFGPGFLDLISTYCDEHDLDTDVGIEDAPSVPIEKRSKAKSIKAEAMSMFRKGCGVTEVVNAIDRAESTTWGYLEEFVKSESPESIEPWVDAETSKRVVEAATKLQSDGRLRPIFEALDSQVPYEQIRIAVAYCITSNER